MAADTQQNLIYTIYFIFLHNFEAIFYTVGIITALAFAFLRPSRVRILLLVGFAVLLFNFEYKKHIAEGLRDQTLNSLVTERQSARIEHTINVVLLKALPLFLPLAGWGSIVAAGGGAVYKRMNTNNQQPVTSNKRLTI